MNSLTRRAITSVRVKILLGGSLLTASGFAWFASLRMADGMAMGLGGFIMVWTMMMAAMMLPAAMPAV